MKGLEDELNLPAMPDQIVNLPTVIDEFDETSDQVVETSREHVLSARELAKIAAQEMLMIAQQSQHPKAYEVLNSIIKTYADISVVPVDLELKKARLNANKNNGKPVDENQPIVNQNLFVGSTAELLEMLEKMNEKK